MPTRPLSVLMVGMAPVAECPGGGNRYFDDLHRTYREADVSVHALVLSTGEGDLPPGTTAVQRPDAPVLRRLLAFAREIRRRAPDVDVLNTHFALYGLGASLSRRGRQIALVVNFQGPWAEESLVAGHGSLRLAPVKRAVEAWHYRRAHTLVTLSTEFAHHLASAYGVDPQRVHVVRPGVDTTKFRPGSQSDARRRFSLDANIFVGVSVRRLTARMGLEELVSAWAAMPHDAILLIAGEGSERQQLEAQIASASLQNRVRLLGRITEDDLPLLYQAADVSVVPSVALEGFGLVVLEALACGTPVIASKIGGMSEVLPDLDASLLVTPGLTHELTARLLQAVEEPRSLPDRASCRAFAEEFSWTTQAGKLLALLEAAASNPRQ